jgi:hypothetical protein
MILKYYLPLDFDALIESLNRAHIDINKYDVMETLRKSQHISNKDRELM